MQSKEKIEKALEDISNGFREFKGCDNYLYPLNPRQFNIITSYIKQLESREQKLINELEHALKSVQKNKRMNNLSMKLGELKINLRYYSVEEIELFISSILKILKGENDE